MNNMIKLRKVFLMYISIFILILIIANIVCVKDTGQVTQVSEIDYKSELKYEGDDIIINVHLNSTNEDVCMELDEYVKGVLAAEMPASYEIEALKAQAIVARTYTINKVITHNKFSNEKHPNADICTDINDCQAYINKQDRISKWQESGNDGEILWNKIEQAVNDTKGYIVTYDNKPIKAFFHANSGGKTENVELVWNGEPIEYLKSVETIGENNFSGYSSNVEYTFEEFEDIVRKKYSNFEIDFNNPNCIEIIQKSDSNRILKIRIGNIEISGIDARNMFSLKSTNFEIVLKDGKIAFNVIGYGHGVGMSQNGANALALEGKDCFEIIKHYYTNVDINKIE